MSPCAIIAFDVNDDVNYELASHNHPGVVGIVGVSCKA